MNHVIKCHSTKQSSLTNNNKKDNKFRHHLNCAYFVVIEYWLFIYLFISKVSARNITVKCKSHTQPLFITSRFDFFCWYCLFALLFVNRGQNSGKRENKKKNLTKYNIIYNFVIAHSQTPRALFVFPFHSVSFTFFPFWFQQKEIAFDFVSLFTEWTIFEFIKRFGLLSTNKSLDSAICMWQARKRQNEKKKKKKIQSERI